MYLENQGYEVVVRLNGEQIEGFEHPALEQVSKTLGCIGEADGTYDFGNDVINALKFYVDAKNNGFEAEVFNVSVYNTGECVWKKIDTSFIKDLAS